MNREELIEALKRGDEFTINNRPVKLHQGRPVVEIRTGRGPAFAHFSNEDLPKLTRLY